MIIDLIKDKFIDKNGNLAAARIAVMSAETKSIIKNETKCLDMFKYHTKEIDPEESIVGEQIFKSNLINENIIGFQNRQNIMINEDENNLFTVINGTGYEKGSNEEGYLFNNFYGTYLLGPLLIRNPYFTDYLIEKILKENKLPYKANHNSFDYIAYNEFINNKKQD